MSNKQGGKPAAGGAKGKKAGAKGKAGGDDKREDVLQAVVLVDSFQDRFKPFTIEKPRCLLPLANVPLIEYTLEFLALNGVQEVFIYCGAHSEAVEKFINESRRWSPGSILSPFSSLEFIRVSDATSVGDFMRDLDSRGVINGDFILVHGDLVSNIQLEEALAKHRARREANRDACMTMVLTSAGDEPHPIKEARVIKPKFLICNETFRCLHYQETNPLNKKERTILPYDLMEIHTDTMLRSDLIDAEVDICTPEVLALWSESFDFELPRKNFLAGVLKDWELNGKLIYAEVLETGYAVRASNLGLYDCLSRDILNLRALPFAPHSNLSTDQTYRRIHGGSYFEEGVLVDRTSKVTKSALGAGTNVGAGSTIERSTIGRRCVIGENVKIKNSYIWDDTVIGDDTIVERSILANAVTIGSNCHVPEGSLVSFGVKIADGKRLTSEPIPRISLLEDDGTPAKTDDSVVGKGGKGALYQEPEDEEDSDDEDQQRDPAILQRTLLYSLAGMNISADSVSTFASHDSEESDDEDEYGDSHGDGFGATRQRLSSFTSIDSGTGAGDAEAFHGDAVHGLVDALQGDDGGDFDSAKLEFMGLRLANNASDSMMRKAIAVAFANRASQLVSPEHGGLEPSKAATKALTSKRGAIKFIQEVGVGGGTPEQAEFALALQKALVAIDGLETTRASSLLAAMLQQLYQLDVLEEDGILAWWADARSSEGESLAKLKDKCRALVEWLENADEEDSDEDDDEDEDSD
ncbi:Nucleotide-diphospho-sugar transferase [Naviculisporaceae sp. PSN 640]